MEEPQAVERIIDRLVPNPVVSAPSRPHIKQTDIITLPVNSFQNLRTFLRHHRHGLERHIGLSRTNPDLTGRDVFIPKVTFRCRDIQSQSFGRSQWIKADAPVAIRCRNSRFFLPSQPDSHLLTSVSRSHYLKRTATLQNHSVRIYFRHPEASEISCQR